MSELILWIQSVLLVIISEFIKFMQLRIDAPLWLLLVVLLVGRLSGTSGGRIRKAYQKVKMRLAR